MFPNGMFPKSYFTGKYWPPVGTAVDIVVSTFRTTMSIYQKLISVFKVKE